MEKGAPALHSFRAAAIPTDRQLTIIFGREWRKQWRPVGNASPGSGGNFSGRYATPVCGGGGGVCVPDGQSLDDAPYVPPCRLPCRAPCRHMVRKCTHGPGSWLALPPMEPMIGHHWSSYPEEKMLSFGHCRHSSTLPFIFACLRHHVHLIINSERDFERIRKETDSEVGSSVSQV